MTSEVCHIIVAAGSGSRYGAALPKQFCELDGRPLLMTTIEAFRPHGRIILVLGERMVDYWREQCARHRFESPAIAVGGATRWESVSNALRLVPDTAEIITVHDGARPVVSDVIINNVVDAVRRGHYGAIPAIPVTDSLRRFTCDGDVTVAVDRSDYRAVQTPQAFLADLLRRAYALPYRHEFTDDASVMEAAGFTDIVLTEGSPRNIKVTNPGDMEIARLYLNDR